VILSRPSRWHSPVPARSPANRSCAAILLLPGLLSRPVCLCDWRFSSKTILLTGECHLAFPAGEEYESERHSGAAIIGKQVCAFGVMERGVHRLTVGIGMIPRGEVGLIFAGAGRLLQVIDDATCSDTDHSSFAEDDDCASKAGTAERTLGGGNESIL
jgi:hypothetical protein